MSPLAKQAALLHNEAALLARQLRNFAERLALYELGLTRAQLDRSDDMAFATKRKRSKRK